jgi:hypothetical protein
MILRTSGDEPSRTKTYAGYELLPRDPDMKECAYCGRENTDEAGHCRECGTLLTIPSLDTKIARPRDWTWLECPGTGLRYAGTILLIGLFYLLSFGPVERYSGRVTPLPPMLNLRSPTMVMMAVSYPRWVRIVYYPAFKLRSASGWNGLYGRYLEWWHNQPGQR